MIIVDPTQCFFALYLIVENVNVKIEERFLPGNSGKFP